jgi:hypothetical protein
MELDPSQFLAQGSSDDDDSENEDVEQNGSQNGDGPPILTSLGLTHINSVSNPFASYAVSVLAHNRVIPLSQNRFFHALPSLSRIFLELR